MSLEGLALRLAEIDQQGLYRRRRIVQRETGASLQANGRTLVDFCSNDYLGLASHPDVVAAFKRGAEAYGVGSTASHLICGHSPAHHALEEELADFVGRERALLFSTGYMANLGAISVLAGRGATVIEDRLNHASLIDGVQLAGARLKRYAHGDVSDLAGKLGVSSDALVVTDGVFSMDGDVAPLPAMVEVAARAGATLMVDDAHGLGVLGPTGGGVTEVYGLSSRDVPVLVGTLGKAFGTFGAFIAGDQDLIEFLIQRARTYVYTTALPPAVAEATRASLRLVKEESWRREKLRRLVGRFREGALQMGLPLMESETPIQPLLLGGNEAVITAGQRLSEAGFMVMPIRPPTVPANSARLRITFNAHHEMEQVDRLLDVLRSAIPH
jgi:8-amino-7-oxononanoate synthase